MKAKSGVYLNTLLGRAMCGDKTCDDLETFEKTGGKTWISGLYKSLFIAMEFLNINEDKLVIN